MDDMNLNIISWNLLGPINEKHIALSPHAPFITNGTWCMAVLEP